MRDHEIAKLVNDLRDIACKYTYTDQLRARISERVTKAVKEPAEHQRVDLGNAARQSYDGLMERIAPLVAAADKLCDVYLDEHYGFAEFHAALKEFKDPK